MSPCLNAQSHLTLQRGHSFTHAMQNLSKWSPGEENWKRLGTSWYPIWSIWSHHTELDMNVAHLFADWSDCLSFYLSILIVTVGEGGGREGCQGFGWWKGGSQWLNDSPHLSTLHKIHKCSKICFASEPQPPGGNFCVQWTLIRQRRRTVPWLHLRYFNIFKPCWLNIYHYLPTLYCINTCEHAY